MHQPLYPIGIQSFEEIRKKGYIYVDKTSYIPLLVTGKYYFLSRPRRFGKSLLLSMLEAYFKGKKDLFEGLAIYDMEGDWSKHPVVHIDFNTFSAHDTSALLKELSYKIFSIAHDFGVTLTDTNANFIGILFEELIEKLGKKFQEGVVILIDEYDKGLLEMLDDDALREEASSRLRPFFNALKTCDPYIKFAFITGVSRFRNTTLFSGANNLRDITLESKFASLLGITHEEMLRYFKVGIDNLACEYGYTTEEAMEVLRNKYDGYRFSRRKEYVYNPFSLLNAMASGQLDDFWITSGTSKSLAKYLKGSKFSLEDLTNKWVSGNELGSTYNTHNPLSLFFQTGYLTISDFEYEAYRLGIPNQEVQKALAELLIPEFVENSNTSDISEDLLTLRRSLSTGDVDTMMGIFKSLLASVPYHEIDTKTQEKHLHLCMYIIFMMLGTDTKCELSHSSGRVDMVAETPWRVYIFEFKIDKTPEEALFQINNKGYAIKWEARGDRKVIKIGVNFASSLRNIDSWIVEEV